MTGNFRLEVSQPTLVDSPYTGASLRLVVTLVFTATAGKPILGTSLIGCLLSRDRDGTLRLSPPKTRVGFGPRAKYWDNALITPDTAKAVIETMCRLRPQWIERIGEGVPFPIRKPKLKIIDETPLEVEFESVPMLNGTALDMDEEAA